MDPQLLALMKNEEGNIIRKLHFVRSVSVFDLVFATTNFFVYVYNRASTMTMNEI